MEVLGTFGDWSLRLDPALALLGNMENIEASRHNKLFLFYALYYARREILLRWKQPAPPTHTTYVDDHDKLCPTFVQVDI